MSGIRAMLFRPVDIASLALFRIAFGALMLYEVLCYFAHDWIAAYWIRPAFHFTYPGFGWVHPWPGNGMYVHMAVLGVLAVTVGAGLFYRASALLFCVGFTYTFLLEQTRYLNHFYFVCLVSFLMIFVPAHRAWSLDAWRGSGKHIGTIPFWPVWLLRAQLAIVYSFAGIAKLNSDWFAGYPLNSWLAKMSEASGVGPLFAQPIVFPLIAWCGLAFDFLVVPFLLWRRTRHYAFCAAVAFHLMNAWFFQIGIFPWFSIAMTTLFFEPDWPRRVWRRVTRRPATQRLVFASEKAAWGRWPIAGLVTGYVALQLLLPFRHWLYPGDVAWTEEGHQFSWRMKLREKIGAGYFEVYDPAKSEAWAEAPEDYLEPWQAEKMITRPELIRQFARYLAERNARELGRPVQVRAHAWVRLNGHPEALLVDPEVDLSREPYRAGRSTWITPRPPREEEGTELAIGR